MSWQNCWVTDPEVTRRVVADFLKYVRSGREPQRASEFMAPVVLAHQVQSEDEGSIERSSDDYADHVRDMTATFGQFDLLVDEFLIDGSRAFARLTQVGRHIAPVGGYHATGRVVREISSVVYHVENGLITQYWIQIDRAGLTEQLARPSDG
jgi:predicted ester cyclase